MSSQVQSNNSEIVDTDDNPVLTKPPLQLFFRYLIPSFFGILAMTTASIIDGIFIGNYAGSASLAAVNLVMPFLSLMFGFAMMLAIGGSVRCGKYIGENDYNSASNIFSKTLISITSLAALIITIGYLFNEPLFRALGGNEELFELMATYFNILLPFLFPQLLMVALYFFLRIDGFPNLAAGAFVVGSALNIGLDYWFIVILDWKLAGAAWATGISQVVPFLILCFYFLSKQRKLIFKFKQRNWFEIIQASYNGISEFINEISAGIIAFILNWILITSVGVDGVAAITVINYLLIVGLMMFFAMADATQVLVSQNFGAKLPARINQLVAVGIVSAVIIGALNITLLLGPTEWLVNLFLDEQAADAKELAMSYVYILWPIFLFNGCSVVISAYFTAVHMPFQSGMIAILRSLLLPAFLLGSLWYLDRQFLWALPIAEAITFCVALVLLFKFKPVKLAS